jgi:methylated-DNA-[protein]-cysteine S-methyltransferase
MIRIDEVETPVGIAYLVLDGEAVKSLRFDQQLEGERVRSEAGDRVRAWLEGDMRSFDGLKLAPDGTLFQQKVWTLLREIPAGETRTYGQLAAEIGSHPRAVGSANGSNPISIIVPCHRVIGKNGSLTGYAWGLHRKEWLLRHEQSLLRRAS